MEKDSAGELVLANMGALKLVAAAQQERVVLVDSMRKSVDGLQSKASPSRGPSESRAVRVAGPWASIRAERSRRGPLGTRGSWACFSARRVFRFRFSRLRLSSPSVVSLVAQSGSSAPRAPPMQRRSWMPRVYPSFRSN